MIKYAKGPVSYLYRDVKDAKTGTITRKRTKQVLWGDWVRVLNDNPEKGWLKVEFGKRPYFMREERLQDQRVLEIIFLDVGQGDGCILTEPGGHDDPRIIVVDAGVGDNMSRFLHWRFRDFPETANIHAAIITHPDKDHYYGFSKIFANRRYRIDHVYHNGIVERTGLNRLGPSHEGYLTDICVTNEDAVRLVSDDSARGRMLYPKLIKKAIDAQHIGDIEALSTAHGCQEKDKTWVPGFQPSASGPMTIEVMGPVMECDSQGTPRLRQFGTGPESTNMDVGKTKNGHSILLRLDYGGFRVLLGGDLNRAAESFLVLWYGNARKVPKPLGGPCSLLERVDIDDVATRAAERLQVDLMKTCHHGSSDVLEEFLYVTNARAYVISSGDRESHVHPRPDLLGLLGKAGRGRRPLLLSTELARSTREREDPRLMERLREVNAEIEAEYRKPGGGEALAVKTLSAERKRLQDRLMKRNVGVYGAINLRTDGDKAVVAMRKEAGSASRRWFYYEMEPCLGGFEPVAK